jgi:phosphatidylglycerol:prolipoprotein diacylglycerol transferase
MPPSAPLCWTWDVDPVLLHVAGPLKIRWYGLWFLAVFGLGYLLLRWQLRRGGHSDQAARGFIVWGVIGLLLGAWLAHRLFYEWDRIGTSRWALVDLSKGITGLSSHGAAVGLMAAMALYARREGIAPGELFDRFSFSAAVGATLVRLGNFFNAEIVGAVVNQGRGAWWAVCMPRHDRSPPWGSAAPVPRHPSQLYEAAIGIVVLAILLAVDRAAGRERRPRWLLAGTFLVAYFSLRIAVEYLKEPQVLKGGGWDVGQWLSVPFVVAGCLCLARAAGRHRQARDGRVS